MILLSDKDPYSIKNWAEFLNQFLFITENNFSIKDIEEAIALQEGKAVTFYENTTVKCPNCDFILQLLPVNDSSSTQTGDSSKSVWLCRQCFYEKFNTKTVKEEKENG